MQTSREIETFVIFAICVFTDKELWLHGRDYEKLLLVSSTWYEQALDCYDCYIKKIVNKK